jgi:hypothetical protein
MKSSRGRDRSWESELTSEYRNHAPRLRAVARGILGDDDESRCATISTMCMRATRIPSSRWRPPSSGARSTRAHDLPPDLRAIYDQCARLSLPVEVIADQRGVSIKTVQNELSRLRASAEQALQVWLEDIGFVRTRRGRRSAPQDQGGAEPKGRPSGSEGSTQAGTEASSQAVRQSGRGSLGSGADSTAGSGGAPVSAPRSGKGEPSDDL